MGKNGGNSCAGNSGHAHIRYILVKDRIYKDEIKVEYCPTLLMLADYFTKPLMEKKVPRTQERNHGSRVDL